MNKTRIDWAEMSWNPVTGCLHGCEYCYARKIANRFAERLEDGSVAMPDGGLADIADTNIPYPYGFSPTLHRYRLGEPYQKKKPQNIFVCSMADLFGEWVPDEWIKKVFVACEAAPQHRYLFLTKNPDRYSKLAAYGNLPPKHWYGFTLTGKEKVPEQLYSNWRTFVSIEPLLAVPDLDFLKRDNMTWVIIGAETGNRKDKVIPKREWVDNIISQCRYENIPVFLKDSLVPIIGEENMRRDFPWERGIQK